MEGPSTVALPHRRATAECGQRMPVVISAPLLAVRPSAFAAGSSANTCWNRCTFASAVVFGTASDHEALLPIAKANSAVAGITSWSQPGMPNGARLIGAVDDNPVANTTPAAPGARFVARIVSVSPSLGSEYGALPSAGTPAVPAQPAPNGTTSAGVGVRKIQVSECQNWSTLPPKSTVRRRKPSYAI